MTKQEVEQKIKEILSKDKKFDGAKKCQLLECGLKRLRTRVARSP